MDDPFKKQTIVHCKLYSSITLAKDEESSELLIKSVHKYTDTLMVYKFYLA